MKEFELVLQGIASHKRSTAKGFLETKRIRLLGNIELDNSNISVEVLIGSSKDGIKAAMKELNLVEVREKMAVLLIANKHGRLTEDEDENEE